MAQPPRWDLRGATPRVLVGILAVGLAVGLRLALVDILGPRTPFLTFYPAVMLSALVGGAASGLVATAGLGLAAYFWVLPQLAPFILSEASWLALGVFVASGAVVSAVAEGLLRARRRAALLEAEAVLTSQRCELDAASRRLADLVESTSDAILGVDMTGAVTSWNKGAERLYGYSAAEAVGRNAVDLLAPPEGVGEMNSLLERIIVAGKVHSYETRRRSKDGTVLDVAVTLSPIRASDCTLAGASVVVRDISDQKRAQQALRESEERFRVVVEGTDNLITRVDGQGRLLYVNPVARRIFGLEPEQCLGRLAYDFVHPGDREATMRAFAGWVAGRQAGANIVNRQVSSTGQTRILSWTVQLHYGQDGRLVAVDSIAQDITELKEAEQALRESERRLRYSQEIARLGQWQLDLGTGQLSWCKGVYAMFELDPAEAQPSYGKFLALVHPDDRQAVDEAYRKSLEARSEYSIVHRLRMPDGRVKWIKELCRHEFGPDGQPLRSLGVAQDITELKQAEEALRASELFSRGIVENSPDCIKLLNAAGELTFISGGGLRLLELESVEPVLGRPYAEFWKGSDRERLDEAMRAARASGLGRFEGYCPTATGTPKWWDVTISPLPGLPGQPGRFLVISRDITERRQAAEALRGERERLATIIDTNSDLMFLKDSELRYLAANAAHKEALGIDPQAMIGRRDADFMAREMAQSCEDSDRAALESGSVLREEQILGRWYRVAKKRVADDQGRVLGVAGLISDITQDMLAFEALRESEERFRQLVEHAPDGIFVQTEGRFSYVNRALLDLYGASEPHQVLGHSVASRVHPDFQDLVAERIRLLNEERVAVPLMEMRHMRLDGSPVDVEVSAVPMVYGGKPGGLAFMRDVHERKRLESLREDMERIARHDLKTPLNAVINLPLLLLDGEGLSQEQAEMLRMIHEAGLRMLDQIDQSLTLYRIETRTFELDPQPVDLPELLARVAGDLSTMARGLGVAIELEQDAEALVVRGDALLCRTMLGNLLKNAVEATGRGGQVRVRLERLDGEACVVVRNPGLVPEDLRDRFFEKYVSAGKRRGAGLGTYSARLSAEAQGGRIAMETGEERGTEITVCLPLWAREEQA